jgi:hypothetical protein
VHWFHSPAGDQRLDQDLEYVESELLRQVHDAKSVFDDEIVTAANLLESEVVDQAFTPDEMGFVCGHLGAVDLGNLVHILSVQYSYLWFALKARLTSVLFALR